MSPLVPIRQGESVFLRPVTFGAFGIRRWFYTASVQVEKQEKLYWGARSADRTRLLGAIQMAVACFCHSSCSAGETFSLFLV